MAGEIIFCLSTDSATVRLNVKNHIFITILIIVLAYGTALLTVVGYYSELAREIGRI